MPDGSLRRRQFVGGLAGVLGASCGGNGGVAPPAPSASACPALATLRCDDAELGTLADAIMATDRAAVFELAAAELSNGRSLDDLFYAAFSAGVRVSSFRTHSNHACTVVESARQLSTALSGADRYLPLLWALDSVSACPDGIDDPRDSGEPIGPLDDRSLPAGADAELAFETSMLAYDRAGAERAIVGLYRTSPIDTVRRALHRWAPRNRVPNGHWAIQVAQYLRIVEPNGWRCAEPVLRHLVHTLATPHEATENPALWADGEQGFLDNQARIGTIAPTWQRGALDDSAAAELALAFRAVDEGGAGQLCADRLSDGLGPQSIWDAILLNRAEIILSSPGSGYDEHCITSVTALYDLYLAATEPDTKLLLLLQAAGWYAGDWSTERDEVLAALVPLEPPASANEIVANLTPAYNPVFQSEGRLTAAAQTLGWFEAGRPAAEIEQAAVALVARKARDWHHHKVTVAMLENAAAVSAAFAPRIYAALMLYLRAPDDEDWARYEEALAAVSLLP